MLICTAEDGRVFEPEITLYEIARRGSLRAFVSELTGIDAGSIICFLSDGQQLRDENVRQLAGTPEDTIYVFNREYLFLDTELNDVIHDLEVPLSIRPPLQDTHSPDAILASAQEHAAYIPTIVRSLSVQMDALKVAAANLDSHVLSLAEVFENFELVAMKELDRQAALLRNHNLDLEIISRIRVHHEFLSPNVRREVEAGLKERMLVDYISGQKMKFVVDSCAKVHDDLNNRFTNAQSSMSTLTNGADEVRGCVTNEFREKAETINHRAQQTLHRLHDLYNTIRSNSPTSSTALSDLLNLEDAIRRDVEDVNDMKNQSTGHVITVLRQVSFLQSTLAELPAALTALETELRNKGGFVHMQRLHNMVYMYGATVIEIVRRKEFTKFFSEKASMIAEVMARLSSNERKRRQVYRGEVHGQLPFDNKGMDEPTPMIEISTANAQSDGLFSLSKEDIALFMDLLDQIERTTVVPPAPSLGTSPPDDAPSPNVLGQVVPHPLKETRAALEKLISRIEGLSAEFDRLVERSVLSPDRMVHSKRRTESDASAYRDAIDQLREMRDANAAREQAVQDEREFAAAEIQRLHVERDEAVRSNRDQSSKLENELATLRAALERETSARASVEARHAELLSAMEDKEQKLQVALAEATSKTKEAEVLSRALEYARAEAEDHHRMQAANDERLTTLLSEQADTLRKLEEARARGEDLEDQIKFARAEGDEAFRALNEATREKDRLLRTQSQEADRLLRDHIAEADGDRAVLEHQFSEMQAAHETLERELKEALSELDVCKADLVGTREELQRAQHELVEGETLNTALREEVIRFRAKHDDLTRRLTAVDRMLADMLDVAVAFRDTNARLLSATQKSLSHAARLSSRQAASMLESTMEGDARMSLSTTHDQSRTADALAAYTTPIDWSDPVASIQILRRFDLDAFSDAVIKAVTTIRKWQKQCKEYRDRARGKISFRNFAKGDLALFLPTRNSVAKPWAAFNVSFPHYFLMPTLQIAAQLETREWIVARITSITERVVDLRDPDTNPYGLGNGVKFYMLEVEDYAPPVNGTQRRTVSAPIRSNSMPEPPLPSRGRNASWNVSSPVEPPEVPAIIEVPEDIPPTPPQPIPHSVSAPHVGPSSLSRLLAQESSSVPFDIATSPPLDGEMSISPSSPPPPPLIISKPRSRASSGHSHSLIRPSLIPSQSPLRRNDSNRSIHSSRPSTAVSNVPEAFGAVASPTSAKAIATTALADEAIMQDSPIPPQYIALPDETPDEAPATPVAVAPASRDTETPSPTASASEGMSNVLLNRSRKRTMSTKAPPTTLASPSGLSLTAGGALASLANSWRIPLGRRRRDSTPPSLKGGTGTSLSEAEGDIAVAVTLQRGSSDARSLLRKFDSTSK